MKRKVRYFVSRYFQRRNIIQASMQKRTAQFQAFDSIGSVAILGKPAQLDQLNIVVKDLKDSGKTVFVFLILSPQELAKTVGLEEKLSPDYYLIDPSEFSWKGGLVNSVENAFLRTPCDAVFDFASDDVRFHQLLLLHPCPFRIGIADCGYPLYDFCILGDGTHALTDIYQQIKKYLGSIRQAQ